MLKSCSYCGRIHDRHTVCQQKAAAISRRQHKSDDKITRFRNSPSWKYARRQALTRDLNLCRVCFDDGYINSNDIQVHHIVPMCEDFSKREIVENLICLCPFHHEQAEAGTIPRAELSELAGTPPGGQDES